MPVEILIRSDLESEIAELEQLVKKYDDYADVHQKHADELPETRDTSVYWRNFYQEKGCYCRQRLFAQQCKLKQLIFATET